MASRTTERQKGIFMNKEQEIAKYRERLKPYIDEAMEKFERKERRQALYDRYIKKLKGQY